MMMKLTCPCKTDTASKARAYEGKKLWLGRGFPNIATTVRPKGATVKAYESARLFPISR